jgi:PBP1b-binding outer membrane lipoprotein LpoB
MKPKQFILFATILFFAACNEAETAQQDASVQAQEIQIQQQQQTKVEELTGTEINLNFGLQRPDISYQHKRLN